jgi:hypothetical protein
MRWVAGMLFLVCAQAGMLRAAVVQGVVLDEETGFPLARTQIVLTSLSNPLGATQGSVVPVRTGERGSFSILSVRPGWYLLRATRRGYAATEAGQSRPGLPGKPFEISDNNQSPYVQISMRRLAAITGSVVDENNIGIPDLPVYIYTAKKPISRIADGKTDDRGNFRVGGLDPGTYVVRSGAGALEDDTTFIPSFHRYGAELSNAVTVRVKLGETAPDAVIHPVKGRLFELSGTLVGRGASTVQLTLITETERRVISSGLGAFVARGVPSGPAALLSEGPGCGGYQRIVVDRDQVGITAVCAPLDQPVVELFVDGARPPVRYPLMARRVDLDGTSPVRTLAARDTITPGLWEFSMQPGPDYYVASIAGRNGGRLRAESDTALRPDAGGGGWFGIDVGPNPMLITVTLSQRTASIAGTVQTHGHVVIGAPVYLELYDPGLPNAKLRSWNVRTGIDGKYRFEGLAPGKYRMLSSFDFDPNDAYVMDRAPGVVLREGDSAVEALEMILP